LKMARRVESMVCADTMMAPTFAACELNISSEYIGMRTEYQ
jgi:hypothetical protein